MSIEELLNQPYYVMDILPKQVPADGGGQYFKVERYYLNHVERLSRQYTDVLLKLNCYYDLVFSHDAEHWQLNPEPETIVGMVHDCLSEEPTEACLYVMLAEGSMLLTLQRDATHMTLYHLTDELLQLLCQLASAAGLFVWSPPTQSQDRAFPEIQAGHAPHGEEPETAHHEAARPRDNETDIQ